MAISNIESNVQYRVLFKNESSRSGYVCIYQRYSTNCTDQISLVWLCKSVHSLAHVNFSWTHNYNFVWMENKELQYGTTLNSSQILDANLINANQVELDYEINAYKFINQTSGEEGKFTIVQNSSIPDNKAFIGMGMSGYPAFIVPTQPNKSAIFTPEPTYWITFGNFKQGEPIHLSQLSSSKKLEFNTTHHTIVAIYSEEGTWSVEAILDSNQY